MSTESHLHPTKQESTTVNRLPRRYAGGSCITDGDTVEEALANAKEAIEFHLEGESEAAGDPVPAYVYAPHVVISNLDVAVPDNLVEEKGNAESAVTPAD